MYKYTVNKWIREHAKYWMGYRRHPKWDWMDANIKPLVPGWEYAHYGAFRDINSFTFYSKKPLRMVPLNGILFPVALFDEVLTPAI
jgi:hypothetical protein